YQMPRRKKAFKTAQSVWVRIRNSGGAELRRPSRIKEHSSPEHRRVLSCWSRQDITARRGTPSAARRKPGKIFFAFGDRLGRIAAFAATAHRTGLARRFL